nr:hypothetical protein HK105_006075 [Polyrhizophydium stewartii]
MPRLAAAVARLAPLALAGTVLARPLGQLMPRADDTNITDVPSVDPAQQTSPSIATQSDAVQIAIGVLCFLGALQSLVYVLIVVIKTTSARRLHEPAVPRWAVLLRKAWLVFMFVCVRALLLGPVVVALADWTGLVPAVKLHKVAEIHLWVFACGLALATALQVGAYLAASPKLFFRPRKHIARERHARIPDRLLPDVVVLLTVQAHSTHTFGKVLKSILHADYPGQQLCIIVVFHPNALPGQNEAFLKALGVDAMQPERPYSTVVDDAALVCFWSRQRHHRDMQHQGMRLIEQIFQRQYARLDNSIVVLTDGDTLFQADTILRGVTTLAVNLESVAATGWATVLPHDVQPAQPNLVMDSDLVQWSLFQAPLEDGLGLLSELHSSATFVRFYALKAIEQHYFAVASTYSMRDFHLLYSDWSKYLATVLQEHFGPHCLRFNFLVQPMIVRESSIHADPPWIESFWSRLANRTSYLVFTPHLMSSPLLTIKTLWTLATANTSIAMLTAISMCLAERVYPLIPLLMIPAAILLKCLLTLLWCAYSGRAGLGFFALPYTLLIKPAYDICILFGGFLTWMIRFERKGSRPISTASTASSRSSAPRSDASSQAGGQPQNASFFRTLGRGDESRQQMVTLGSVPSASWTSLSASDPRLNQQPSRSLSRANMGRDSSNEASGGSRSGSSRSREAYPELLLIIFAHITETRDLYSLALVCSGWHACANPMLWRHVVIHSARVLRGLERLVLLPPPLALQLSDVGSVLRADVRRAAGDANGPLQLERSMSVDLDALARMASRPVWWRRDHLGIERLDIATSSIVGFLSRDMSASITRLVQNLPNCTALSLPPSGIRGIDLFFRSPETRHIAHLDISQISDAKRIDQVLSLIATYFRQLQGITFGHLICAGQDERRTRLRTLARSCQNLQSVKILGQRLRIHAYTTSLLALFKHCANLRRVHIENLCCTEYRSIIGSIAFRNKQLEYLHVRLAVLPVSWADHVLLTLGRNCHELRYLHIQPFPSFSDAGLLFLTTQCPNLTHLVIQDAFLITSIGLSSIARWSTSLRKLDISRCTSIDLASLTTVTDGPVKDSLRHLVLNATFRAGDQPIKVLRSIQQIARRCSRLSEVEFSLPVPISQVVPALWRPDPQVLLFHDQIVEYEAGLARQEADLAAAQGAPSHPPAARRGSFSQTLSAMRASSARSQPSTQRQNPHATPGSAAPPSEPCPWCDRGACAHVLLRGRHIAKFCQASL